MHSMPCWKQMFDGLQWVKERSTPPIREERLRRPDLSGQAGGHRWGDGAPQTRRSSSTGRLRRWAPCSPALGRYHPLGIRSRPPPVGLAPRQGLGDPVRAPCAAQLTLTMGQGLARAKAGGDGPAARRGGSTCCHRVWGAKDTPWAHLPKASALAPCAALGVPQPGRGPPRRWGLGPPAPLARWGGPGSVGVQHGVPVGGPWSAGAPRQGVSRGRSAPSQQPLRPGLRSFAAHAGQDPAPGGGTGAPHPGFPRGGARERGAGQMRFFGRHAPPNASRWPARTCRACQKDSLMVRQ